MMSRQKPSATAKKTTSSVFIHSFDPAFEQETENLAERLGLPLVIKKPEQGLFLTINRQGLGLCLVEKRKQTMEIRVDFTTASWEHRLQQVRKELLIRAMGRTVPEKTSIIDATGGLGRDSFLLAAAGFTIRTFERNPILAALLANGLERTAGHATMEIGSLITLHCEDARNFLETNRSVVDIVYLDPMFPPRKKSAKVKKELQTIQQIVGNERDYEALFTLALQNAKKRVVVKRPKNGPWINNCERPSYSLPGETIRFDIYLTGSADH
jgi:16S rRNA (guanine1516-N2)-methyltransferase